MTEYTGARRLKHTLRGQKADRVPVMPKIWVDFSVRNIDIGIETVIENPFMAIDAIRRAALGLSLDGFRAFFFPERKTEQRGGVLYQADDKGNIIGIIDVDGGLATVLNMDSQDYVDISNPYFSAFCQFFKQKDALVKSIDDARRIAIPDSGYYISLGFDKMLGHALENAEGLAVVGDCGSVALSYLVYMMGMERAMFSMMDEPGLVHMILQKGIQIAVEKGRACIDSGIRILRLNDSAGNMSVISPDMWREFVLPSFKEVCRELKNYCPDVLIYSHICGNTFPVASDLAGSGLNCIGPMDPLGGHTPGEFRAAVGEGFCLMGGVNTITLLKGSPEDVYEECVRCIDLAGRKGAFVLGSGCAVPRDTPAENIKAMVLAAAEYED